MAHQNSRVLKKIPFIFSLGALVLVTACGQSDSIKNNVRESEIEAQQALQSFERDKPQSALRVDNRPWYGSQSVPIENNKSLPNELTGPNAITVTFNGPTDFEGAARKIESVTNIPVSISYNIYETTAGSLAQRQFLPSGGQEVAADTVVWSGSLQNLLNQIANIYGAEWSYVNGQIQFTSELTKTFMLNALSSDFSLTGSASSAGNSTASSAVPNIGVDGTTTVEIWGEISEAVQSIIGEQGQVAFSPSTGSITVTARPDVMRRVENYLRYQNEKRLRRIAVTVKVLSVTTNDQSDFSMDISGAIQDAIGDYSISSDSNTDGLSLNILQDSDVGNNLAAALTASNRIERVNIVHSGSLVTLSDQPAPLQVGRQIAFLERVSASGDDSGSVSLEPGTIDVGLFMSVLPRIVDNDKILMRLNIAITDADPNFRQFGTDDVQIELPEIDTTGFLQNAVVGNGETLVLAGFEKRQNNMDNETNPVGLFLGGRRQSTQGRELLVLVINSKILPQQPLTVIGQ